MKIHELKIEGFKSIGSITLTEPNPFTVFVGPNGAGKSNIFEALELLELCNVMPPKEAGRRFGNASEIFNQNELSNYRIEYHFNLGVIDARLQLNADTVRDTIGVYGFSNYGSFLAKLQKPPEKLERQWNSPDFIQFINFSRIFVGNESIVKDKIQDDSRLASDATNLEKVLKRIFKNQQVKEEIEELLNLLIPGFSSIEIITEELSGSDNLVIYEDALKKPLTKRLISDGTYNILAIIAAVYQSEEPQFLCIEEPENGLNPKVVQVMVELFRDKCKEKGHYIWLNTHSQTLVAQLTAEEIILVNKVKGQTQVKQIQQKDLHGLKMDEALFTNVLGGGIPW